MMGLDAWDRRAIAASIAANGFLRRSPWPDGGRAGHREWLHFAIHDPAVTVVINVSIVDDLRPSAPAHRERVGLLALVRDEAGWDGDLEEIHDPQLRGGQLDLRLGDTAIAGDGHGIRLRGGLRGRAIGFELELVPAAFPSVASNVAVGVGPPINWLVVPRLFARGTVTVGASTHRLDGALAYHDHNWGHFSHQDFAWQWGQASTGDGTSVVLARLLDGAHATSFMQALMVWGGARQARVFRGRELEVRAEGFLRPPRPLTVPRRAALLVGNRATEVPARLHLAARADGDELTGAFEAETVARVLVPNDHDLGTTVIHEVIGRLHLAGHLHDRPVAVDAPATFELVRSVA